MIKFSDKQHCWGSSEDAHVQESCTSYQADLATEREPQLATGERAE